MSLPDPKERYQGGSPSCKSSAEGHQQHFPSSCRQPRSTSTRRARTHSDHSEERPSKAPRLATSQPPDQSKEHPSESPRRSPTQPPDKTQEHPSKSRRRSPSQPPDRSQERPSKAPRLTTSQPPGQSKERPSKAAPISVKKPPPPPPRRIQNGAQQARAAAEKLARLQSRQAHLQKDQDRQQLQSTTVAARIPQALSDIPALQLVLDKHFAFRDYQELRLRSLPAELATLYLQLRLPYGQPKILARIQASLVEKQHLHLLHPLESQRIDTLARDVQDA